MVFLGAQMLFREAMPGRFGPEIDTPCLEPNMVYEKSADQLTRYVQRPQRPRLLSADRSGTHGHVIELPPVLPGAG